MLAFYPSSPQRGVKTKSCLLLTTGAYAGRPKRLFLNSLLEELEQGTWKQISLKVEEMFSKESKTEWEDS